MKLFDTFNILDIFINRKNVSSLILLLQFSNKIFRKFGFYF